MGVSQSLRAAHQWAISAALRGKPDGLYSEGQVYEQGNGVPVDIAKACERYLETPQVAVATKPALKSIFWQTKAWDRQNAFRGFCCYAASLSTGGVPVRRFSTVVDYLETTFFSQRPGGLRRPRTLYIYGGSGRVSGFQEGSWPS